MHAITLPQFGGPEVLTWTEVADPEAGPGEVLIDVAATTVNRADLIQRRGLYPPPPGAPPYPGLDCAGRISALGEGVTGWQVGDEVCALLSGGGYAERVAAPAGQVLPIPSGLSAVEAASLPEVACTVWSNVFQIGRLAPGEVFLVHGGGSGVGTLAIQLAARHGARVFCTAGSSEKLARCRDLGAETGINYRAEDFVERVRDLTGGHGADVILDHLGGPYLAPNVDLLAIGGRLLVIGTHGGRQGELDLGKLLSKRGQVTATGLRTRPAEEKAAIVASVREEVWPALASGEVRPVIDRVLPLVDAAEAHRIMEASLHFGKVVLTTDTG